jgi:ribosomal protein S18 acetylase RimI-like enzyme
MAGGNERMHMEIREARPADRPALRDVARRSLEASYPLAPKAITGAIEEWYDENRLRDMLRTDEHVLLVVDVDDQAVAFSDAEMTSDTTGELYWLHVDPDYRSENFGEQLYEATRERLSELGATTLQGRVLAVNEGGNAFYERHGLTKVGEEEVDIDGTPYVQNIYTELEHEDVEAIDIEDDTVYVNHNNTEHGSLAPFHVVYTEEDGEDLYGYWCSKCGRFANAMDAMGRIQCDHCGNTRKATRWDSAYL